MALMSVNNIGRRIGSRWLLRDVNFTLEQGETLSIFGPSGSGKSLLARIVAGIDAPDRGQVTIKPESGTGSVSLALQEYGLASQLTVYENLMFFAELSGLSHRSRARKVSLLMDMLRLTELRGIKASQISHGAAARIEIARALLPESTVYAFDSLLDSLSPGLVERLWDYLLSLRRDRGAAIIIITAVGRIAQMCSNICVLVGGSIGYFGPPEEFRRMAGDDMVVVGDVKNPFIKNRIREHFAVTVSEEDGFLSFRAGSADKVVADLLSEFGTDLGCVYLKRPTLEDALEVSMGDIQPVAEDAQERSIQ